MDSMNGIKAIFFDLDGTLRHNVPHGGDVFSDYVITLGLPVKDEDRRRGTRWEHLYWASSADLRDDLIAHSGETEKFWIEYSRRRLIAIGASQDWASANAPKVSLHMGAEYRPESIVPNDVRETLIKLRDAGYILAVLSNRDKPFIDVLESHRILEFFHFSLAGGEVNSYKPDTGLFEEALKRVNITPNEAVYVGDNYFADVVGSRRAGLTPVLYDPDDIFPEADCTKIRSFHELNSILKLI
jgi:putative hydrolase of the HAD superfamily